MVGRAGQFLGNHEDAATLMQVRGFCLAHQFTRLPTGLMPTTGQPIWWATARWS